MDWKDINGIKVDAENIFTLTTTSNCVIKITDMKLGPRVRLIQTLLQTVDKHALRQLLVNDQTE